MYSINRIFGISSQATHYEYRRVTIGEYGDRKYKTFHLTHASMKRVYRLIKGLRGFPFTQANLEKKVKSYTRIFPS